MPPSGPLTRADGNAPAPPARVRLWLNKAGLMKYHDALGGLTESEFGALGMMDLAKFGILDLGDKQKLFRLIKNLNAEGHFADRNPKPNTVTTDADSNGVPDLAATPSDAARPVGVLAAAPGSSPLLVSPADDTLLSEAAEVAGTVAGGALLDVDAVDDEFLLSPVARGVPHAAAAFAPSPERAGVRTRDGDVAKDAGSPLDQLHELSRGARATNAAYEAAAAAAPPPLASPPADQPRIRVVVRKRPLNRRELSRDEEDVVTVERALGAGAETASRLTVWEPRTKVDLTRYTEAHEFAFDDAYPEDVGNDEIYATTVAPLVGTIFDRCKVTCFAYGQTGSGKTYTMSPLPTRAAGEILAELARPRNEGLALWVSFFEIYGGKVYDLLNGRRKLVIREDARSQMCVVGLQEFEVDNVDLVEQLIEHGTAARCTGSTGANSESSRSHAIMQFALKAREEEGPANVPASVLAQRRAAEKGANHAVIHGKFSFIDLAGSERGADTSENDRQTRIEGAEINKSLLALKECIRALDRGSGHVPFRGSKLTEVLRDSFMGDSRTVMIANISPATGSCEHTLNTLRYAYRVKELRSEGGAGDAGKKTRLKGSQGAALAADGVTPLGNGGGGGKERKEKEDTEKERRAAAAAKAAAARAATRRSSEAASVAELASPRRVRPKSAVPTRAAVGLGGGASGGASASFVAPLTGGGASSAAPMSSVSGGAKTPTKRARPQSARPAAGRATSSVAKNANEPESSEAPLPSTPTADPRVTAFVPKPARARLGGKAGKAAVRRRRRLRLPLRLPAAPAAPAAAPAAPAAPAAAPTSAPAPAPASVSAPSAASPVSSSARAAAMATAAARGEGPPVDVSEMAAAHDALINVILEEEEEVIAAHRAQIESTMELVKREMGLLAEVDKPGSAIDVYVERLAEVLERKAASIAALRERVAAFQTHLREEEVLSKTVGLH